MATVDHHSGTVMSYDEHVGRGVLRDFNNDVEFEFHCAAILDGSRTVSVGAEVRFEVAAGHGGRLEAGHIDKL